MNDQLYCQHFVDTNQDSHRFTFTDGVINDVDIQPYCGGAQSLFTVQTTTLENGESSRWVVSNAEGTAVCGSNEARQYPNNDVTTEYCCLENGEYELMCSVLYLDDGWAGGYVEFQGPAGPEARFCEDFVSSPFGGATMGLHVWNGKL